MKKIVGGLAGLLLGVVLIAGCGQVAPVENLAAQEKIGELQLGLSDSEIVRILGEAEGKGENTLWGADGLYHQDWSYPQQGITLDMVGKTSKRVENILVEAPCQWQTSRGIGLGSSWEEVQEKYAAEIDPKLQQDVALRAILAGDLSSGIEFAFSGGSLSSISIGGMAE